MELAPLEAETWPCPANGGVVESDTNMHFVYIIQSQKHNRYYIGCTNNIEARIKQHNDGQNYSTKNGVPWKLITYKKFKNQQEAYRCEKKIKSYKGGDAFKKLIHPAMAGQAGDVAEWLKAAPC